jgi:hypothetical protein
VVVVVMVDAELVDEVVPPLPPLLVVFVGSASVGAATTVIPRRRIASMTTAFVTATRRTALRMGA